MIVKTHFVKKQVKTEIVDSIAKEAIYQLQFYKNLYLTHEKIDRAILMLISTIFIHLIVTHVYAYLTF